jgi:uncharacterized repeat protein (TIGR01451 family)
MSSSKRRKSNKNTNKKQSFLKPETVEKKINKRPIDLGTGAMVKPALNGKATVKGGKVTAPLKRTEVSRKKTAGVKKTTQGVDKATKKTDKTLKGIREEAVEVREVVKESNYVSPGHGKKKLSHEERTSESGVIVPASGKAPSISIKHSHKKLWIILPIVFIVIALGVLAWLYYYTLYFNKPNFEINDYNKMLQSKSGSIAPGQEIQYSIKFKNTGNTDITELSIETDIPANTDVISSSSNSKISADGKKITFYISGLAKDLDGNVFFSVRVINPLDNGTEIKVSDAVFNYTSRKKQKQFAISQDLVNTVTSSPDFSDFTLSFKDLNKNKISMGDDVLFTLTLGNTGDMDAANVKLVNVLPDKFILYENSLHPAAVFNKNTGEITWDIAKINTGEAKSFSFKAKIGDNFDNLETFKDTAAVIYENISINNVFVEDKVFGFPNFSTSTNTVEHPAAGDVWAGDTLKYTVNITNSGLRAGEDIEITCPIPEGTIYVKDSGSQADFLEYEQEANILKWKIKTIDVNETTSFTFETRISGSLTGGGTITSAFSVNGDDQAFDIEPVAIKVRSYIFQTVVCMGDSQIVVSNWPAYLDGALESTYPHAEYNTIGSGVPQQMAYQGVRRFDSTVAVYHPQIVVIGYGTNDVGSGISLFAAGIQELIDKAKGIGATIIVHSIGYIDTGIHPTKRDWPSYNDVLQEVCANNGVPYVDIAGPMSEDPGRYVSSDGMHWTPEGGQLVAHLVYNTLRNYLDGEGKRK